MEIFKTGFGRYTFDGDTIEAEFSGFRFVATVHHDSDTGEPWKEHDGHGPVSDWTCRDKKPGELILCETMNRQRFYDFAEACKIARHDGWGVSGGKLEGESAKTYAARAAQHDFEVLRAWCNDEWAWCGIAVQVFCGDVELTGKYDFALWGIEYNYPGSDNSYLLEVANQLAEEAMSSAIERAVAIREDLQAIGGEG